MAYIGIDGVHCNIVFKKQELDIKQIDVDLKNADGTIYGNVKTKGELTKLTFNVPLMLRETNVKPYGTNDIQQLHYIKIKLLNDLNKIFGNKIKEIIPSAIEVNITKKLKGIAPKNFIDMLKLAFIEDKRQLMMWINKGIKEKRIEPTGMLTQTKKNEYKVKVYDKSKQLEQKSDYYIDDNVLRFEIIFQGRKLKQIYGKNYNLFYILENIKPMILDFKYIYKDEILKKLDKELESINKDMFEELTMGFKPTEVFLKYNNIIYDKIQIERCLKDYYSFCGKQNQSKTITKNIMKQLKKRELQICSNVYSEIQELL